MQPAWRGDALDGDDAMVFGFPRWCDAGEHRLAIKEDGAGTTVALVAPLFRAREAEGVTQRLEQREMRGNPGATAVAVYVQLENGVHA
jgi:hypothetical protein